MFVEVARKVILLSSVPFEVDFKVINKESGSFVKMQLDVHFRPIVSMPYLDANSNNPIELIIRVQTIWLPGRRLSSHIFRCNATEITDFQFGESFCWAGEPVIWPRTAGLW